MLAVVGGGASGSTLGVIGPGVSLPFCSGPLFFLTLFLLLTLMRFRLRFLSSSSSLCCCRFAIATACLVYVVLESYPNSLAGSLLLSNPNLR